MSAARKSAQSLRSLSRLALPYFRSEERWSALLLLVGVIGCELASVAVAVRVNLWRNDFYQSLQNRSWDGFVRQFWVFSLLAIGFIFATVYQQYLTQWLTIRWRRWMTAHLLDGWLDGATHYRMRLASSGTDNPDQRVADDTRLFIADGLALLTGGDGKPGLIGAVASLFSFAAVLWALANAIPLTLFGVSYHVPGYLVWMALAYAMFGTFFTHLIGRKLIPLNYEREQREADFRFALVRLRENAEPVALMRGEDFERSALDRRFRAIVQNWHALILKEMNLNFFSTSYKFASQYFPYFMVSPMYFAGGMQFGKFMQIGSAFNEVRTAFSFFVAAYPLLAELVAAEQRLTGFEAAILTSKTAKSSAADRRSLIVPPTDSEHVLAASGLRVLAHDDGHVIGAVNELSLAWGERLRLDGASGAGKSSVIRALAGIWPFIEGHVHLNAKQIMVLPQQDYMPLGTLAEALAYPSQADMFSRVQLAKALNEAGLGGLVANLEADIAWSSRLSGGERQRIGFARALLHKPDLLILDEAGSALEESTETELHDLIRERLPETAVLTISHREIDGLYHDRCARVESSARRA